MILERIATSVDVKNLSKEETKVLADEIRDYMIKHVSKTGGHLAASLGVVELTIALHQVFDVEYDRIVWDVGHQSYPHKILSGRWKEFSTLRQMGGLSGFPKTDESESDAFNTGHSSTSISAAVGFAVSAKLRGEDKAAVAVIGDGSLGGGMAFEAMNHAGAMKIPLIVVLNDNGMSISKNVGGLSKKLKRIRNTRRYFNFKTNVKSVLDKIPLFGPPLKRWIRGFKKMAKRLVVRSVLFEDLGFSYMGPVDGHNVDELKIILQQAKQKQEPVFIHIRTKKGKGYTPAEKNPEFFHGVSHFDSQTGRPLKVTENHDWSSLYGQTMLTLAKDNPKLVAITAAMPSGTGLKGFQEQYPERFFNVGIAEQHAVTFSAGLAKAGLIPCFAVYSTFLQRGYDQLLHDVALQRLHAIFCIDRCGLVGADGETHQGVYDLSYLMPLPEFRIFSPSNGIDFQAMLAYAVEEVKGPVAIRYPRGEVQRTIPSGNISLDITKANLLRDGTDVLIIAVGTTVFDALEAAEYLSEKKISVAVLDIRSVKPIDVDAVLKNSKGKKLIVSVEDHVEVGGFGQQIQSLLQREVLVCAYPNEPIVHGAVPQLKEKYRMSGEQIAKRIEVQYCKN